MEQILTVLAGQPNCGKSTIFNMLTGARQYVANYPGVTVEKKAGSFVCGDTRVELVDLPGTYSLASWSPEEMAARQFIVEEDPAQIVAVLDASTLEKSLYLCLQLLEMRRPTLAVLNMMDVAAKRGIRVDADALSQALGIPVIRAQASKGIGKQELYSAITARHGRSGSAEIVDYGELETDIREITRLLPRQGVKGYPSRWFAIKLLSRTALPKGCSLPWIRKDGPHRRPDPQCRESWATRHGEDMVRSIAHARFAQARDHRGTLLGTPGVCHLGDGKGGCRPLPPFLGPAHPAGDTVRFLPGLRHAGQLSGRPGLAGLGQAGGLGRRRPAAAGLSGRSRPDGAGVVDRPKASRQC